MLRWLLSPISLIYALVLNIRHSLYDNGVLSACQFDRPVVVVGNLALGGTGKTPMIEFLLRKLKGDELTVLSRGYGRKTKGFKYVEISDTPDAVGDEPLQLKRAFPEVDVAVCENRCAGVKRLIKRNGGAILLDDAFQHRNLKAGLSVLLLRYSENRDYLFPLGTLRDLYTRRKKADIVVITKCPILSEVAMQQYCTKIGLSRSTVHFSRIRYSNPVDLQTGESFPIEKDDGILLLTAIADATPLLDFCNEKAEVLHQLNFKDHHAYTIADLRRAKEIFDSFDRASKRLLTTAKDAVKLRSLMKIEEFADLSIHVIPIEIEFLDGEDRFLEKLKSYVGTNQ